MHDPEKLRTAMERNIRAIELKPSLATGTVVTRVESVDGPTCVASEDEHRLTLDMPAAEGGNQQGPDPGFAGRAALGACLAMSCLMYAARLGVRIDAIAVEVQADYDMHANFDMDAAAVPGYTEVRCVVDVDSPAPREDIEKVLDAAERCSTYTNVFARATPLVRELRLQAPVTE